MNNDADLVYNREKIQQARDLLDEIKDDISAVDYELYDAVMKIGYAYGIEEIERDNTSIDLRVPERLMIQCREETTSIRDNLSNQVHLIEAFLSGEKTSADITADLTNVTESTDGKTGSGSEGVVQALYGVPSPELQQPKYGVVCPEPCIQPLYGAISPQPSAQPLYGVIAPEPCVQPLYGVISPEIQPKYGVVCPEPSVQPLYGVIAPEPCVQPLYGVPSTPVVQPKYGVVCPPEQLLYGPPPTDPTPVVQPKYGVVCTPETMPPTTPTTPQQFDVYIPSTTPGTTPTTETQFRITTGHESPLVDPKGSEGSTVNYNAIPNTGKLMEKETNLMDYAVPVTVGAIAGMAGVSASQKKSRGRPRKKKPEDDK